MDAELPAEGRKHAVQMRLQTRLLFGDKRERLLALGLGPEGGDSICPLPRLALKVEVRGDLPGSSIIAG